MSIYNKSQRYLDIYYRAVRRASYPSVTYIHIPNPGPIDHIIVDLPTFNAVQLSILHHGTKCASCCSDSYAFIGISITRQIRHSLWMCRVLQPVINRTRPCTNLNPRLRDGQELDPSCVAIREVAIRGSGGNFRSKWNGTVDLCAK